MTSVSNAVVSGTHRILYSTSLHFIVYHFLVFEEFEGKGKAILVKPECGLVNKVLFLFPSSV